MNTAVIREKLAAYPVPAISGFVALVAAAVLWYGSDTGGELTSRRDELKARADRMADNLRHARNLGADNARAGGLTGRIASRALDFDSPAATAEFAARRAQAGSVVVDGLPAERGKPVPASAAPYASGEYTMVANGDFPTLLAFLTELENDPARSIVVVRTNLMADDNTSKTGRLKADIGFRVWGSTKGIPGPVVSSAPEKSVPAPEFRSRRMEAAEALFAPARTDLASASNPFGDSMSIAVADVPGSGELAAALRAIDYSIGSIDGNPVVKLAGMLPKRVNAEFEVTAGGRLHRVRIVEIGDDGFAVVTPAGKKIRISPRQ